MIKNRMKNKDMYFYLTLFSSIEKETRQALPLKLVLWLKNYLNLTYYWFLEPRSVLRGLLEGKIHVIDEINQNKVNAFNISLNKSHILGNLLYRDL